MEIAVLAASRFIPSPNRELSGFARSFHSSVCGKAIRINGFTEKYLSTQHRGHFIVTSRLGKKVKKETVVPDPDYRIPIVLLGLAGGLGYTNNLLPAAPVGLLGLLLLFQTTRVRFVFDDEALEVKIGGELDESGENVFVGGKNRWKYSTFVNWELWWPNFPILVYFKETQTKPEGQVHFFPVIFAVKRVFSHLVNIFANIFDMNVQPIDERRNGKQLYDVMVERAGPSQTSLPK